MNIIVAGAGGFIGSWIVREALWSGHRVLGISRSASPERLAACAQNPDYSYEALDITIPGQLSRCSRRFDADAIIHAAAQGVLKQDASEPNDVFRANVLAGVEVGRAARETSVRVVWIGTCMEYSPTASPIGEQWTTDALSRYGVAKNLAWRAFLHESGSAASHITLRPFYIFGPGGDPRRFATAAALAPFGLAPNRFGDASLVRDFVYVGDCANAVLIALDKLSTSTIPSGLVLNLCSGEGISFGEFARTAAQAAAKPAFRHRFSNDGTSSEPAEPPRLVGRCENATRFLGWRAGTSLIDGLKEMMACDVAPEVRERSCAG